MTEQDFPNDWTAFWDVIGYDNVLRMSPPEKPQERLDEIQVVTLDDDTGEAWGRLIASAIPIIKAAAKLMKEKDKFGTVSRHSPNWDELKRELVKAGRLP